MFPAAKDNVIITESFCHFLYFLDMVLNFYCRSKCKISQKDGMSFVCSAKRNVGETC